MKRYRKKPVEINAMLWQGDLQRAALIITWIESNGGQADYYAVDGEDGKRERFIAIETLEGVMKASPGDYIIQGVQGEFYPCKPDIFTQTYEEVV
jgi:hypothetical protein